MGYADHRRLGFGVVRGAEAFLRGARSLIDVAADVTSRIDDVLALRSDAFLVSWIESGTDRTGGGAFERPFLVLCIFGADGLMTCNEQFEVDRAGDALARFDQLVTAPPAPRIENAATRNGERSAMRGRPAIGNASRPSFRRGTGWSTGGSCCSSSPIGTSGSSPSASSSR